MTIKPMIRSNMCINAHPRGCARETERQIEYVKAQKQNARRNDSPLKAALILGCSTGYGLASRVTAAFGYGAATIGVSFEKEGGATRGGTPGWYNNLAFERAAERDHIPFLTMNIDAFSDEARAKVIDAAKKMNLAFDLVVYSLASPVRTDPDTGVLYKSVLKPIGRPYSGKTVDPFTGAISEISAEPATEAEIEQTVKVMGGEDWERWIKALFAEKVLADGCKTVAYSYIGPPLSHAIYRDGTIGQAKKHLEKTADGLNAFLAEIGGGAFVSVNKGLVTRSSAVIPIIPLYLSVLFKVMKERGSHEGCIEQIARLFSERLYTGGAVPVDESRLIRIDDWEMDPAVQDEVNARMAKLDESNIAELADLDGYRHDFLAANGFDIDGVDYSLDVERLDAI